MMRVPVGIQDQLDVELRELEKERPVGYFHSFQREAEKKGIEKGLRQSILSALRARFGKTSSETKRVVMSAADVKVLQSDAQTCRQMSEPSGIFSQSFHAVK